MADDLSETAQTAKSSSDSVEIFKSRSIDPWQLTLIDNLNNTKTITASVMNIGAISYRAVDRLVQEDSIQLQWSGKAEASAGFIANERVDYSSLPEKAALVFDVIVDKKPTSDVKLSVNCGSDCGAETPITTQLQSATSGQWQTLSVSLNCFKKAKLDMLLSPFTLSTAGELSLTLHHVRIEAVATPVVSCQ